MVWLGGAAAMPYAVGVLIILGVASGVSVLYAAKLGIQVADAGRILRLRLVPYGALLVLFLVGAVRAAPSGGFGAGFAQGTVGGGVAAVLWLAWAGLRARRRGRGGED